MNLKEVLEKATPRPWARWGGVFFGKRIGEDTPEVILARHAVNNFEGLLKALNAQPEGHSVVCSWMASGKCDCYQSLRRVAIRQAEEVTE